MTKSRMVARVARGSAGARHPRRPQPTAAEPTPQADHQPAGEKHWAGGGSKPPPSHAPLLALMGKAQGRRGFEAPADPRPLSWSLGVARLRLGGLDTPRDARGAQGRRGFDAPAGPRALFYIIQYIIVSGIYARTII